MWPGVAVRFDPCAQGPRIATDFIHILALIPRAEREGASGLVNQTRSTTIIPLVASVAR